MSFPALDGFPGRDGFPLIDLRPPSGDGGAAVSGPPGALTPLYDWDFRSSSVTTWTDADNGEVDLGPVTATLNINGGVTYAQQDEHGIAPFDGNRVLSIGVDLATHAPLLDVSEPYAMIVLFGDDEISQTIDGDRINASMYLDSLSSVYVERTTSLLRGGVEVGGGHSVLSESMDPTAVRLSAMGLWAVNYGLMA